MLRQAQTTGAESSESCCEDRAGPLPEQSPRRFDHYQVTIHIDGTHVELGRGAMGVTFKAFDTILGNEVALKVIDRRIAAHPEARERFLREARAAARLRHPNVASVFYYGTRKSDGQWVNAFTRWNWSRAKRWKRACAVVDRCHRLWS
jgi:hypothetical protein